MRRVENLLMDILKAIDNIENYTHGIDYRSFESNQEKIDAVLRNFEIIGEAVKNLPNEIKRKQKEIEWKSISGMRDIIVHEYFGVDLEIVWKAIKEDLPGFKKKIKRILDEVQRDGK
ncbi:MAG: DUF86 domain-containing protein [Candidatus Anstonellales archaeon]